MLMWLWLANSFPIPDFKDQAGIAGFICNFFSESLYWKPSRHCLLPHAPLWPRPEVLQRWWRVTCRRSREKGRRPDTADWWHQCSRKGSEGPFAWCPRRIPQIFCGETLILWKWKYEIWKYCINCSYICFWLYIWFLWKQHQPTDITELFDHF